MLTLERVAPRQAPTGVVETAVDFLRCGGRLPILCKLLVAAVDLARGDRTAALKTLRELGKLAAGRL